VIVLDLGFQCPTIKSTKKEKKKRLKIIKNKIYSFVREAKGIEFLKTLEDLNQLVFYSRKTKKQNMAPKFWISNATCGFWHFQPFAAIRNEAGENYKTFIFKQSLLLDDLNQTG